MYFRNETGNAIRMLGIMQDVTEDKEAEMALSESEMKYSTLVEKLRAGIVTITDGLLSFVNVTFTQFLGYSREAMFGADFFKFVAPEYREFVLNRYNDRMAGKDVPPTYEIEMLKKDGQTLQVELDAKRINLDGHYSCFVSLRDMTEPKQAAENLRKSEERFRIMFEQAAVGVALSDCKSGRYVKVNQERGYPFPWPWFCHAKLNRN